MRRALKWAGWSLLVLLVAGAGLLIQTWYFKPLSIDWFYARVFLRYALDDPELLTQLRVLEPLGLRSHNGRLADISEAHQDQVLAQLEQDYATLHRYDASSYRGQDRLSYEIFDDFVGTQVRGKRWRYHNFPVNQLYGVQNNLPNLMTQQQQVADATDAEHYIARLTAYPAKMQQLIESMQVRESKGIVPPRFVMDRVQDQIRRFLAPGPAKNTLTVSFEEKLAKIPADRMDAPTREVLRRRVEQAVATSVTPAYEALTSYLATLATKTTRNDGAWALPDGAAFYQYAIEANTTTSLTAEQIHALGLAEVARIGAEMDRLLAGAGYTEGSVGERMQAIAEAPAQLYPDTDAGRAQILADYDAIIREISAGLDPMFRIKPKAGVVVKRVPPFTEKSAAAAYYTPPPLDGSQPGVFFANLGNVKEIPRFGMRTIAYHEAVPGHHLQASIAQELKGLPLFRSVVPYTAYAEGWGLYAERLAWEAGYEKDPLDNLGRLQAEMFRSVRLVVDTGLHAKRWTREQAIEYMIANTGMAEGDVTAEIERYMVNPGQALAYKVGMLKILELRERARAALGPRFDLRDFHDEVLANGPMPLSVLERVIDAYIARRKAA